MADSLYFGNAPTGLVTNRLPFNIDNESFPTMFNMYAWRGRSKRKRGTLFLGHLNRQIQMVANATPPASYQSGQLALVGGARNLFQATISGVSNAAQAVVTINGSIYEVGQTINISGVTGMTGVNGGPYIILVVTPTTLTLQLNTLASGVYGGGGTTTLNGFPSIVGGSINFVVGGNTYTDTAQNGVLTGSPAGSGTINYATGDITISGGGVGPLTGSFSYYPDLPSLGDLDFGNTSSNSLYPLLLAMDQNFSYQCNQAPNSANFFSTSFYKASNNPVIWSGQDYQLFWGANYQGATWVTNNKPGFHFVNGTYVSGSGTTDITFTFTSTGVPFQNLIVGDYLWFNEWDTGGSTINGITGIVLTVVNSATGTYIVRFTSVQTVSGTGISEILTNSIQGQDGIKWYDGDPTSGTGIPTGTGLGWVNFSPPLTDAIVPIGNNVAKKYYLVGALAIVAFKRRLIFFSPYVQASTGGAILLQDVAIWSWDGTPYYTVSDTSNTASLVPTNQVATYFNETTGNPAAPWFIDQTGLGGWLPAGIENPIITVNNNEDAILLGFGGDGRQVRFVFTGNDLNPFLFFNINQEMPSMCTFSAIGFDQGCAAIGNYGITFTDQQSCKRIDLAIPDYVFQIQALNNGVKRVNGIRDFFREWVYWSYPLNNSRYKFPTQTFMWNYRDETWAILYENYTSHGLYRPTTKRTWQTLPFKTWIDWREPWNTGSSSPLFPNVIAGNPQGYLLVTGQGTGEAPSGTILALTNSSGDTQITSPNHCVSDLNPNTGFGDFLQIQGAIGIRNNPITAITLGTTTVITTTNITNPFAIGQFVTITGVNGTTELNGNSYKIIARTTSQITLDIDSTSFTTYVSGGIASVSFNGQIGKVIRVIDDNNFVVDIPFPTFQNPTNAYLGLGTFSRLSQPLLQTKQFNPYWGEGRQVRLGTQKYLFDFTENSQVTLNIYLSQDPDDAWNDPTFNPPPNGLLFSRIVFTCPESTNIGLTPANINLQTPTAKGQYQIWHRFAESLIGESFQLGITLSEDQMKNITYATSEIALHGIHLTIYEGPLLA